MTREFEFFHGVVFARLIHSLDRKVSIARFSATSNSSYVVDEKIGLYIKHCTKRMTPWGFTFRREHQTEMEEMRRKLATVYVVLVCNDDGLVCLEHEELKQIIASETEPVGWVSAARRARQMYGVKGSNGALECKVGAGAFPGKMFSNSNTR